MKVVISRGYEKNFTKGTLLVFDGDVKLLELKSLELPDNGNQKNTSCIPEGVYDVEKYDSPTKGECFHVLNVPGRDSILIHKGNYATGVKVDTKGCILVGQYFNDLNKDNFTDIAESTKAMQKLLLTLPDKFKIYIL